jgi:hypothetical protein
MLGAGRFLMHDGFYRVCWMRQGREVGRCSFDDLVSAKNFAAERLRIQKIRKGADSARVIDADDVAYFEFHI